MENFTCINTEYYHTGIKWIERYVNNNKPEYTIFIWYNENGYKELEFHWKNNSLHREDGPAWIYYNKSGVIKNQKYCINGTYISSDYNTFKEIYNIIFKY